MWAAVYALLIGTQPVGTCLVWWRSSCERWAYAAETAVEEQPAVLLLLLARTCMFMQSTALPHVMETLAGTFPGQGGSSGSGQPPAFVAGQVGK